MSCFIYQDTWLLFLHVIFIKIPIETCLLLFVESHEYLLLNFLYYVKAYKNVGVITVVYIWV